ncbi:MAG: uracil-DNA glycosylase [Candidatus Dadabacteria bacterium]|nr:MAG: uracil-DNA glycosylase [Candidatus Dadabacteria bacterium]
MSEQIGLFQPHVKQNSPTPSSSEESATWKDLLREEMSAPYFKDIKRFIKSERQAGKVIYPSDSEVFNALAYTPFDRVRVVILGQDPYHGPNQAHGLCFSVKPGVPFPPSLHNIFQELRSDLGIPIPQHGCLVKWAKQGVLLLNAVLTVEAGKAGSHHNIGWERFTDAIVNLLNQKKRNLVFLLWGSQAQKKGAIIDPVRHHILKAPHPSPLSAHRGFFGCKHFSQTNSILASQGYREIDWDLNTP